MVGIPNMTRLSFSSLLLYQNIDHLHWSTLGGVLWGPDGTWIEEFQHFLGTGSTLNAEPWAILHDLQMAKLRGIDKVVVESDCLTSVKMANECCRVLPRQQSFAKLRKLQRHSWRLVFSYLNVKVKIRWIG